MTTDRRNSRPILVNGEHYVEPIRKGSFGREPRYPRTFEEARELLLADITSTESAIAALPNEKKMDNLVVCLRLNSKFIAKSYSPESIISNAGLTPVGSRRWIISDEHGEFTGHSKMIFVRTESLRSFKEQLHRPEQELSEQFTKDIRKLDHISLISADEQILGFDNEWRDGPVEFVIHPMGGETDQAVQKLLRQLSRAGVEKRKVAVSTYASGLTFMCAFLKKGQLGVLRDYNPLRTAHPLRIGELPHLRRAATSPAPQPNPSAQASSIRVGIFDGGIEEGVPLLEGHVVASDLTTEPADPEFTAHGTAVAGAILYGHLGEYKAGAIVPQPTLSVESFRVFPLKNAEDINLYSVIDEIEAVVPARPDIQIYNLSFGPCGPILDDEISRFTFALDSLAYQHKVLFVVAVGNDGAQASPWNRIQSPADVVNGIGVGAYTFHRSRDGIVSKVHADYSCRGPGREGCKVKPDISAFGGSTAFPFILVGTRPGTVVSEAGTSFAAPLVTRHLGEIVGRSARLNSLAARVLTIHNAKHPNARPDNLLGHGCASETIDELVSCDSNRVTVIFQSSLRAKSFAKLPIPFVTRATPGNARIRWTVGALAKPDAKNPDEYTVMGLEDVFYPNNYVYSFFKGKKKARMNVKQNPEAARQLLSDGYEKSKLPQSASGNQYRMTEEARRAEFKWDSVVSRNKNLRAVSIDEPFLVLHALGRNEHDPDDDPVHYAVAVTIEVSRYAGDLYNDLMTHYRALQPLSLRALNEILIRT